MLSDGTNGTDKNDIPNQFNDYFSTISEVFANRLPNLYFLEYTSMFRLSLGLDGSFIFYMSGLCKVLTIRITGTQRNIW